MSTYKHTDDSTIMPSTKHYNAGEVIQILRATNIILPTGTYDVEYIVKLLQDNGVVICSNDDDYCTNWWHHKNYTYNGQQPCCECDKIFCRDCKERCLNFSNRCHHH